MALTKIPKTLLDTSAGVNLGDNEKLLIGASDDLQIYHDGNNSYITDTGTGDLKIGGANIVITTAGGTKYFEGASNRAFLFHTGNQKLVTTSTGIQVTGNVAATTFSGATATASGGTNTTALASTAFVQQELTTLIGGAPSTLNDLSELAAAINNDANYNTTLTTALATKAPLASPALTGTVTAASHVQIAGNLDVVGQIAAYNNPGTAWGKMILRATDFEFKNAGGTIIGSFDTNNHLRIVNDFQMDSTSPRLDYDNGDSNGSFRLFSTSSNAATHQFYPNGHAHFITTAGTFKIEGLGGSSNQIESSGSLKVRAVSGSVDLLNGSTEVLNTTATGVRLPLNLVVDDNVSFGTTNTYSRKFVVEGAGDLMMLRSTNAGAGGAQLDLIHDSASAANGDSVGIINFSNTTRQFASVTGKSASGSEGALHLGVRTDASNYNHNALVIDASGNTDISGRLHIGTALSDTRITLGSTGTENTNSSSNVRSTNGNLMYNAGSSSHIWELAGAQKMNLPTNGRLTFVGTSNTEGISLGSNHRIYGGANRAFEASTSATGQISIGEGYSNGTVKVYSKFVLGTFPQSTTNTGEAWIGRAADRQDGTMTVQLGGNDHTGTKFEIVDRAWSKVMYSFAGEAPGGTISTQSQGYMHVGSQQSTAYLYLGSQGGAFGGNSTNWLRASGTNFMLNAAGGNFLFEISGSQKGYINSSGFNNGSDVVLKENIEDIEYGINTVNQLRPRKFDRIDAPDVDKAEVGFIAQEVEPIIPELISNSKPEGAGGQITKGMNYGALTSVLVKAIQEQQVIIDDLKSRIEALEG